MKSANIFFRSVPVYGILVFFLTLFTFPLLTWAENDAKDAQRITGLVVDKDDKPVQNAVVRPKRLDRNFESLEAVTDQNGRFELDRPDQWCDALLAQTPDGNLMGTVSLDNEQKDGQLKIVLLPSRTITGIVTDADAKPVENAFILAISSLSEIIRTQTDAEGRFTFRFPDDILLCAVVALKDKLGMDYIWTLESPTTSEYRLFGMEGDPSKRKKSDGPFKLQLDGVRPVRFKVVDEESKPAEGIVVRPWYFTKAEQPEDLNIGTDLYRRISNSDGVVVFDFFPVWQTQGVTFWSNHNESRKMKPFRFLQNRTNLKPESFDAENEIVMRRAATLRGTVRFPDGRPAVGWQFRAQGDQDQFEQCITDREGRYAVAVIPGSIINLSVEQPRGPLGEGIEKDWACRPRRDVDTGEKSLITEDFVLEKGFKISGSATIGDERKPIERGSVHISPLTPEEAEEENPPRVQCWWWASIKNGRYEFYTTPGDYRLWCQSGKGERKSVHLESGKELTVDFHVEETRRDKKKVETLRGKIQTDADPPQPIAEAIIMCRSYDMDFHELYRQVFRSDENGEFEIPTGEVSVYIQVLTKDGKQGLITRVSPTEKNLVIVPKPTATITGKMIRLDTGAPVVGRRIESSIRIMGEGEESRFSTTGFSQFVSTDKTGTYRFSSVPTGLEYSLSFRPMPRGEPESEQNHFGITKTLGQVSSKPGETVNLGTHQYQQQIDGDEEYSWVFRQVYSRFLENNTLESRFKVLLDRCRKDDKNLLVIFAATEVVEGDVVSETYGPLPRKLMKLMYNRRSKVFETADKFYVMGIPTDAKIQYGEPKRNEAIAFAKRHNIDESALDEMMLCFFDPDGKLLATEKIDEIIEYDTSDNKPAIEFKMNAVIDLLKKYDAVP